MTDNNPFIQVKDLDFTYPDGTKALESINVSIKIGEFIALIGQNGSGKTTLSKLLNGLYKPSSGDVIVDGLNSKTTPIVQMVRRVGYVFQNPDHQLFNNNCWMRLMVPVTLSFPRKKSKSVWKKRRRLSGYKKNTSKNTRFSSRRGCGNG